MLEETALGPILEVCPAVSEAGSRRMVAEGIALYTRFGFTTATEGRAFPPDLDRFAAMAEAGELAIDVVAFPDSWLGRDQLEGNPWLARTYRGHFRIGGVKGNLDVSPQGKTAWLTKPYLVPPAGQDATHSGYPMLEEERALAMKVADLAILDANPLEVDPAKLWELQVLETIKEGRTVYARD